MKKVFMGLALLAITAGSLTASAQRNDRSEERMAKMVERQAENLAKSMKLDKDQKATFVELYKEYQDTLRAVRRGAVAEPQQEKGKKEELTEEEAEQRIITSFEQEAQATALKQAYYKKFREHFTAAQLVSVFIPQMQQRQDNRQAGGGDNNGGPMQGGPGAPGGFGGDW